MPNHPELDRLSSAIDAAVSYQLVNAAGVVIELRAAHFRRDDG